MRISVGAALAAVIALVGCGGSAQPQSTPAPQATAVAVALTATQPPAPSEGPTIGAIPPLGTPSAPGPTATPPTTQPSEPSPPTSQPTPTNTPKPTREPDPNRPPPYDPKAPKADPDWQGRYSMYRPHTHSVQKTDWYCVPTSIQMMLNLIDGDSDRSEAGQRKYWEYAQAHSRYPLRDNGADPGGWVAAMDHWGVPGYSVGVSDSMQDALWLAAKRMRLTGKPVGLIVWGDNGTGGHAWVMTGFESTDDPKKTDNYEVTSVQAMGSLWPYGTINGRSFDPGPKDWIGYGELRQKFPKLHYDAAPAWDGRWITVIP